MHHVLANRMQTYGVALLVIGNEGRVVHLHNGMSRGRVDVRKTRAVRPTHVEYIACTEVPSVSTFRRVSQIDKIAADQR